MISSLPMPGRAKAAPQLPNALTNALTTECSGFARSELELTDGTRLTVYEAGAPAAPPLMVVNPVGVCVLLVSRLMRRLAQTHHVVTWMQRGADVDYATFRSRPNDYDAFLADLVEVHRSRLRERCPVVAICSGASLALRAAARGLVDFSSLTLISPTVIFDGHVPSLYEQTAVPYMRNVVAEGRPLAELLVRISRDPINSRAATVDGRSIIAADRAFLADPDSVMVQAHVVSKFFSEPSDADIPRVSQPTLILCARDDEMVHVESARLLAGSLKNASLHERAQGGHHLVYLDSTFRDQVAAFLRA